MTCPGWQLRLQPSPPRALLGSGCGHALQILSHSEKRSPRGQGGASQEDQVSVSRCQRFLQGTVFALPTWSPCGAGRCRQPSFLGLILKKRII